jgi:hypothetical protein
MTSKNLKHTIWLILAASLAVSGGAFAKGPGSGGKPPVESTNNLSYPAVGDGVTTSGATSTVPAGALGVDFSYGCAVPETIGTSTYPNTSCVNADGTAYDSFETCSAGKCDGTPVERIYWQKNVSNKWSAETIGGSPNTAAYLDWGDNLETTSWTSSSVIRVEQSPYADLSPTTLVGFQMWHVFGQGTNELWGVHADSGTAAPLLYQYDSPYAFINTAKAYLSISKLEAGATACQPMNEPDFAVTWDPVTRTWTGAPLTLYNTSKAPELAISGKYVYGYNWSLKTAVVPTNINKAGWWRLTFYTPGNEIAFTDTTQLVPPVLPDAYLPDPPAARAGALAEADTGPLFTPVIDVANNLTYIDICLSAGKGGGGGKGGGKP